MVLVVTVVLVVRVSRVAPDTPIALIVVIVLVVLVVAGRRVVRGGSVGRVVTVGRCEPVVSVVRAALSSLAAQFSGSRCPIHRHRGNPRLRKDLRIGTRFASCGFGRRGGDRCPILRHRPAGDRDFLRCSPATR